MIVDVVDNFLPDPDLERIAALKSTYHTETHNNLVYHGISKTNDEVNQSRILKRLGLKDGGKWVTFYRRYLKSETSETFIHPDSEIGQYTAILFLNTPEQCFGGTAFWQHKLYKWDKQPTAEQLVPLGLKDEPPLWKNLLADGFDEYKWQMIHYVPMLFNRLIIFDSRRFHSRYPKTSFGSTIDNARLIKVFFYTP